MAAQSVASLWSQDAHGALFITGEPTVEEEKRVVTFTTSPAEVVQNGTSKDL